MIETHDRKFLRREVLHFIYDIRSDRLYNSISSVADRNGWYVHARSDHSEIRAKFFELLRHLHGFKAHVVVAKKDLNVFAHKHHNNATEFYFDVLHHLLNKRLLNSDCACNLYLSQRGNNALHRFREAVDKTLALRQEKDNIHCNLEIVPAREMPEFSIIDYLLWAVQRNLLQGEDRYFEALRDKYETVVTL